MDVGEGVSGGEREAGAATRLPAAGEGGPTKPDRTRGAEAEDSLIRRRFASIPPSANGRREALLAIGVGFRKRCSPETLAGLVREALSHLAERYPDLARASAVLVTIAEKDRPTLHAAAALLNLPVVILPKSALTGTDDRITVVSERTRACFGIPSIAEAAALAAAGPASRLIVARIATADATCAIAVRVTP